MEVRQTVEIRVRGTVQGVGFRPTVWRLACDEGLVGEVFNDGFGVLIRTTGNSDAISQFLTRLHSEAPPLSQIENVETQVLNLQDFEDFRIAEKQTLQFRMEMFNAPNHVELGNPATDWGTSNVLPSATFGTITSTRASMRQIQFALKYNF